MGKERKKFELDLSDIRLINILQTGETCAPRINRLAELMGYSVSTVHGKVKKLENSGVILGYSAIINEEKLGRKQTIFVLIRLKPEKDSENLPQILAFAHPSIQEAFQTTGNHDLVLKVKVKDIQEYTQSVKPAIIEAGKGQILEVTELIASSRIKEYWRVKL